MNNILTSKKHKKEQKNFVESIKNFFQKQETNTEGNKEDFIGEVKDFLKDLVIIVIIVLAIRTFLAMPFQINGQSMYSSYYDKEFIIVDRLSYRVSDIERGDVIVFKPHTNQSKEYYLKRIIGIPGDTVRIEEGKVSIKSQWSDEFQELDEVYLDKTNKWYTFVGGTDSREDYHVPKGEYFVLWDNRNHSTDSRQCFAGCSIPGSTNFVKARDITGKVFLDLWYFNFRDFAFVHPELWIDTTPRFLDSPKSHDYK